MNNTDASANRYVTTLDVWDTLLRRNCHPDEVKLASIKHYLLSYHSQIKPNYHDQLKLFHLRKSVEVAIGNTSRERGNDDEYDLLDVWSELIAGASRADCSYDLESIARELYEYELSVERQVTYADKNIQELIKKLASGSDTYLLSDFYVGSERLHELVRHHHPQLPLAGALSSVSVGLNKRSGRIFEYFRNLHGVQYSQHIHVGDNSVSDFDVPRSLGITAHLYTNEQEEKKHKIMNAQFESRLQGDLAPYWEELCQQLQQKLHSWPLSKEQRIENIGIRFSPIFVLYVIHAIQEAQKLNLDKVYYFTREGEFLKLIHEAVLSVAAAQDHLPKPVLLEVSRLATFGPSIEELSFSELNRIWTMYPRQSLRAFLSTLGLEPNEFAEQGQDVGLDLDVTLDRPWLDKRFMSLVKSARFRELALQRLAQQRKSLIRYLSSKGITSETDSVFVVDIGWRGTIQDNLAHLLPSVKWHGQYVALFRYLNPQPDNATKSAFLFNDNFGSKQETLLSPQAPLEMLFNSPNGSVVGYTDKEPVQAQRNVDKAENLSFEIFTKFLQRGALSVAPLIWQYLDRRAILASALSAEALDLAKEVLQTPPRDMANAYFALTHNETFGNNHFMKHSAHLPYRAFTKISRPREVVLDIRNAALQSGWRGGFYSATRLAWMKQVYIHYARPLRLRIQALRQAIASRKGDMTLTGVLAQKRPDISSLVNHLTAIDTSKGDYCNFNERHAHERNVDKHNFVINWIVPDFGYGSGGHVTILRFVRHFQSIGIHNRIYVSDRSAHASPEALRNFISDNLMPIDGIELHTSSQHMESADIAISTFWKTAYESLALANVKFKAYFIQDYEPYFYPMSSNWLFAEDTYRFGFYGVCASRWLHTIAHRFGMPACHFNLGYDPNVYYPDPLTSRDANRVLVYMRPSTERRGTELLISALTALKRNRPKTRIAIFGTEDLGYSGVEFEVEMLGLLNEEELRRQHSMSSITLLTSLTNYSLIPVEAMACGSVVVDVDVESMRETFGEDSPIRLVTPRPLDMARAIAATLDDQQELQLLSAAGIEYSKNFVWDKAFSSVENDLFAAWFSDTTCQGCMSKDGLVRAPGASKIFYVKDGVRYGIDSYEVFERFGFDIADVQDIPVRELLATPNGGAMLEKFDATPS